MTLVSLKTAQRLAVIAAFTACTCTLAKADLIPNLTSITPDGSNFDFNYTINLSSDEDLNSGAFVTIYDITGFVSVSVSPSLSALGWSAESLLTGLTPSTITAPDDPTIPNVTFSYTGASTPGAASFVGFTVVSSAGEATATPSGFYAFQATSAATGGTNQGDGSLSVPFSAAPESATLALSGFGLVLLGWCRKLFHRA